MGDRKKLLDELNDLIENKQSEASEQPKKRTSKAAKPYATRQRSARPKPTRAQVSRTNGRLSRGPATPEGKQRASVNSLKHGFYAHIEKLNPRDAPNYQRLLQDIRLGLLPDGAVEELMVRELAMLSARLQRLEAAEYAILCSEIDAPPEKPSQPHTPAEKSCDDTYLTEQENEIDCRAIAAAFLNTQDDLDRLHKIEVHLRRAYNRTWDRLARMQRERRKLTPQENAKRTYHWICAQEQRQKPDLDPSDFPPPSPSAEAPPCQPDSYPHPLPENRDDQRPNPPRKEPQS